MILLAVESALELWFKGRAKQPTRAHDGWKTTGQPDMEQQVRNPDAALLWQVDKVWGRGQA